MLPCLTDHQALAATRRSWHALAEHVVAPAAFEATRRIGLRVTPGGFGTPAFTDTDGHRRRVRIEGVDVVGERDAETRRIVPASLRAAARLVGIEPGAPADWPYAATTPCDADAALHLDTRSAQLLGTWFGLAGAVLEELREEVAAVDSAAQPSDVQLWPEHFDVAVEIGDEAAATRGTFGASPGDDAHPEPYLYVTRWSGRTDDPFWNDTAFAGASLGYREVLAAADARAAVLAFFRRGRAVISG